MKKIGYRLLTLVTAAVLMTGCAGLGSSGGAKPTENSVMIEKDGSVRWQSVETYEAGDYTEEETVSYTHLDVYKRQGRNSC